MDEFDTSRPDSQPNTESDSPEAAHASKLERQIKADQAYWDTHYKRLKGLRTAARGRDEEQTETNGEERMVRANLIHSTIKTLMPHVYARNPELAVTPSDCVDASELAAVKLFAKTLGTVLNQQFERADLKGLAKRCVRGAMTSRLAWSKVSYQREYGVDPIVKERLEDAQDNVARLQRQMQALEGDDQSYGERQAMIVELNNTIAALHQQLEVVVQRGLVLARVQPEHLLPDPAIPELELYAKARRITELCYMPLDEAEAWFDRELKDATRYPWHASKADHETGSENTDDTQTGKDSHDPLVLVYEVWVKQQQTVYRLVRGEKAYATAPWQPERLGEQWYPYFPLFFDDTDGYVMPLSLTELLQELQDEYNDTRTQLAEHRELSIPHYVADAAEDRQTLRRYRDKELGEIVLVDARGRPINQVIQTVDPPAYNPAIYDTAPIRTDVDMMSGTTDANRGSIIRAKTATEAEISQAGLTGRTDEVQDRIEDWIDKMAHYAAEVLLQELDLAEVQRIAGPSAVWPQLSKDDLFEKVKIEIRAGTSGKPDKRREQESWQEMMPVLMQLQERVYMQMAQGIDPSPTIALARETIRRFDDSLEIEDFFPPQALAFAQNQQPPMMGALAGAMPPQPGGPDAGASVVPITAAPGYQP